MIKIYRGYPTMHTREWIIEHPDLSKVPFYLEALENMDIKIVKVGSPNDISLVYSFDNENWEDFDYITTDYTITGISVLEGQKLYLKSKSENGSFSTTLSHYYYIKASKKFNVAGNIMSLIYNNFIDKTEINSYCFNNLFHGSTMNRLIDASNLILPATTLSESCYNQMFASCQYLEKAPKILPAITLTSSCYSMMFYNCRALTYSPELPATVVANSCYFNMFGNCYKLMNIPKILPATTLKNQCYSYMFQNCKALIEAPKLPATSLTRVYSCYEYMFDGCTSLTTAPNLPATTFENGNYKAMFNSCSSITELHYPASIENDSTFISMTGSPQFGATNATVYYDL